MTSRDMTIGPLSRQTGCKVQTIRYYEEIGLLPPAARTSGNHRVYTQDQANRLAFIRHSRQLGFSLLEIRELLALVDEPDHDCRAVDQIAKAHLEDVEHKISRLLSLKKELQQMITACAGGSVGDCWIIEALVDHDCEK